MGLVKVRVSDEVEMEFRKAAMEEYGYAKGSLSQAAEEALKSFSSQSDKVARKEFAKEIAALGSPVRGMAGILKHVKKTSVELQHEVGKILSEKYARHRRKYLS